VVIVNNPLRLLDHCYVLIMVHGGRVYGVINCEGEWRSLEPSFLLLQGPFVLASEVIRQHNALVEGVARDSMRVITSVGKLVGLAPGAEEFGISVRVV
jgi:hypothetical protein